MPVSDYDDVFDAAAKEWNVDPDLLRAVATQESQGDPNARSKAGAIGLMQIMPGTAKDLGVANPRDPVQSIYGGAKYLSQLLDKYKNPERALAAYNAGPERVDAAIAGRGTLPAETQAYVPAVSAHYKALTSAAQPATAPPPAAGTATSATVSVPATSDDDDAFLARTGAKSDTGAPAADDDSAFLARTGAKSSPAVAAGTPSTPSTTDSTGFITSPGTPAVPAATPAGIADVDMEGNPVVTSPDGKVSLVQQGPTTGQIIANDARAVGGVIGDTARGVAEGYGTEPVVTVPTEALQNANVFNKPGEYNTGKAINEFLVNGGAGLADVALRGGNALLRGYQAGVSSAGAAAGAPLLGRDLAALPEAFQGSPTMLHPGIPPDAAPVAAANELSPAVDRPYLSPSFQDAPVAPAAQAAIEQARTTPANPLAPESVPVSAGLVPPGPTSAVPGVEQPSAPSGPAAPNSVGAAATPGDVADMSTREMEAARQTSEGKAAIEPAPAGEDNTIYVPGSSPTKAERMGDPGVSQEEILLRERNPGAFSGPEGQLTINNNARVKAIDDLIPSPMQQYRMEEARSAQWEKDNDATFSDPNVKPADTGMIGNAIKNILEDPRAGMRDSINKHITPLLDKLKNADGTWNTDPNALVGFYQDLGEKMGKNAGDDSLRSVNRELQNIKLLTGSVIEEAAPGFKQQMQNYADASQKINAAEELRAYRPGLTNTEGQLMPNAYRRMMVNLSQDRGMRGVDPSKGIDDDTMATLQAVHSDLKRTKNIGLGKAYGSNTNLMGAIARAAGLGAAHAGLAATTGMAGNMLLNGAHAAVKLAAPSLEARRINRLTAEHLAPPSNTIH